MNNLDQLLDLATQHHKAGRLPEAEALYRQILAQQPRHSSALHRLGVIALQVQQYVSAADLIARAIASNPGGASAHVWLNLGFSLHHLGQIDAALEHYRKALSMEPNFPEALNNLGNALKDTGQLDEAIECYRKAALLQPDDPVAHSNLLYTLHLHPSSTAQIIHEEHRRWYERYAQRLKTSILPFQNDRDPDRRLRIGYVSPDLRQHSVGRFLAPLLEHHDRNAVEVFCYSGVPQPDAMTERLRAASQVWRPIFALSDEQAANLIREDRIDILVDLTMHASRNRLLIFARKPAPVQASYLAYCSTTGLETIDHRITDPYLDPPDSEQQIYVESSLCLPKSYWCYEAPASSPPVSPLPRFAAGHITFASLNNPSKITQPALLFWSRLLRENPGSRLILHASSRFFRQRIIDLMGKEGIDSNRIEFVGYMPLPEYLAFHHRIDIALDPFPYAGGTTSCDALWMGVPVISLVGKLAVHRAGLSILSNIGLPQFATKSEDDYLKAATELANDIQHLSHVRSTLRQQMLDSPLMDAKRFAKDIELAYRQMWRRWCTT